MQIVVRTPNGPRNVFSDKDSFLEAKAQENKERLKNFKQTGPNMFVCARCDGELYHVAVRHALIEKEWGREISSPEEVEVHNGTVIRVNVYYCLKCDPIPEPEGDPVLEDGSHYNCH